MTHTPTKDLGLTSPMHGRQHTMIAYTVNYYPSYKAEKTKLIYWHKEILVNKVELLAQCNEDLTHMSLVHTDPSTARLDEMFLIHWEYNNIPTQEEWSKMQEHSTFRLEYRVSPAAEGNGKVVVIVPEWLYFQRRGGN